MKENLITKKQKLSSLKLLLNSKELETQDKYKKLLQYLFDATIENRSIKESDIAIDCFDKDDSFDPTIDSYVRVYLSKLRKKLEHYYLTEGTDENVQIAVPKGHYSLEFLKVDTKPDSRKFSIKNMSVYIPIMLVVSVLAYFLGFTTGTQDFDSIPGNDFIWEEILKSNKKTLIVMGDYYFFSYPYSKNRKSYIRDVEINSDDDLNKFKISHPEISDSIKSIYHTYLDEHIPLCISHLLPSFIVNNSRYEYKLASEVQLDDFNKYNIVYIGSYKALNILSSVVGKLNFHYKVDLPFSSISFTETATKVTYNYSWQQNNLTSARNDYAMVIKVKGPNNNAFMFFLSEHDFGNLSTVKYFSNVKKIAEFEKKLNSKYFEALFEVKGIKRTDFSIDLLNLNQLHNNFTIELDNNP